MKRTEFEICQYLLEQRKVNPNINDAKGIPILMKMAEQGSKEIIELYISCGGDLNVVDINKRNALHFSAEAGKLQITQFLVSLKVDFQAKNSNGKTPRDLAKAESNDLVFKFLTKVKKK